MRIFLWTIFCLMTAAVSAADWKTSVDGFLDRGFADLTVVDVAMQQSGAIEAAETIKNVPDSRVLYDYLCSRPLRQQQQQSLIGLENCLVGRDVADQNEEMLLLNKITGSDGVERPWVLYLPGGRSGIRPLAMLIALHGGVSRQSIYDDPVATVRESPWLSLARSQGMVLLFPFGQEGATWWDSVGMTNVRQLIRTVKHHINIDDDRVYLAGFSDGASAGFLYAMTMPDDFAAVIALNGHMGVGSLDGGLPLYAPNLAMTPVYAVTTENDDLFPTRRMAPTIDMARQAGARIDWRRLPGTHTFDYHTTELLLIARFMRRNTRNRLPVELFWEAGSLDFSDCRWLSIGDISNDEPADWHIDHNCIMSDEEINWGFTGVRDSDGIKISRVDRGSYAEAVGMRIGDILLQAAGQEITSSFSLKAAKEGARCGEPFDFTVRRAGRRLRLPGILPQPGMYYLFAREVPSAAVRARRDGNVFTILGSRVSRLKLRLHPDMFDPEKPVRVVFNGRCIFSGKVKPDMAVMLAAYAANRDRKNIPVAIIDMYPNR